jgi:hypothetical protein
MDFEKERTGHCEEIFISACRPYYDQIYNCNLEISPTWQLLKEIVKIGQRIQKLQASQKHHSPRSKWEVLWAVV